MRILLINSVSGFGSTGHIVEDITKYLRTKGHECYIAFSHGETNLPGTFKYGNWIEHKMYALNTRIFGQQGLYAKKGTRELIKYINEINPDIIHLHNIHGNHLHFPFLFSYLCKSSYSVFWTFHDCWPFTGGCTYFNNYNCFKWKIKCDNYCPHYKAWFPDFNKDRTEEMFFLKKMIFLSINKLQIITVSDWLKEQVEQSFFKINY